MHFHSLLAVLIFSINLCAMEKGPSKNSEHTEKSSVENIKILSQTDDVIQLYNKTTHKTVIINRKTGKSFSVGPRFKSPPPEKITSFREK